jgi:hypothetical protein
VTATISLATLERMARDAGPHSPLHQLVADAKKKGKKERKPTTPPPPSQRRTMKLVVPMPPNFSNPKAKASRNPFAAERRKKRYWQLLDQLAAAKLIPPPPSPAFGAVTVTSMMIVGGRMDRDNSVARHKFVFDWLQGHGYLHNDRLVDWSDFPRQRVSRPRRGAIITGDVAVFGIHRIELELREP